MSLSFVGEDLGLNASAMLSNIFLPEILNSVKKKYIGYEVDVNFIA